MMTMREILVPPAILLNLAIFSSQAYAINVANTATTATSGKGEPLERKEFNIGGIDIGFQPRIMGGVMYYEYEQDGINSITPLDLSDIASAMEGSAFEGIDISRAETSTTRSEFTARATFPTLGGGGTFFIDRFFIDVYASTLATLSSHN